MDNRTLSIYKGVTDTKGVIYPIEHVINRIKSGEYGLREKDPRPQQVVYQETLSNTKSGKRNCRQSRGQVNSQANTDIG